jgi:AcrR family transcriptional regulator
MNKKALRVVARSPILGRSERNKARKLDRIKSAARRLFGRKGFERTSIGEIARAADVGIGTVFLYAPSKQQLLVLCFRDEVGTAIDEGFRTAPRAPLIDQAMHIFGAMISHSRRNIDLARVFVRELTCTPDDAVCGVSEVMDRYYSQMKALIEAAQRRGEIRSDVRPDLLALNLFSLYVCFLQRWLSGSSPSPEFPSPGLREVLETQFLGLDATHLKGCCTEKR